MTTNVQVGGRVKGGASSMPGLVLLAGWLVPGAGHLLLGKWLRGLLLFLSIVTMFFIGIALKGKIYSPNTGDLLDILNFAGDLDEIKFYSTALNQQQIQELVNNNVVATGTSAGGGQILPATTPVSITASGETGEIVARAEYAHAEPSYLVRYTAADGRATEAWWTETALIVAA